MKVMMIETSLSERMKKFYFGCCFKPLSPAMCLEKQHPGKFSARFIRTHYWDIFSNYIFNSNSEQIGLNVKRNWGSSNSEPLQIQWWCVLEVRGKRLSLRHKRVDDYFVFFLVPHPAKDPSRLDCCRTFFAIVRRNNIFGTTPLYKGFKIKLLLEGQSLSSKDT